MARLMTGADLGNSRLTRGRKARAHNHNLAFRPRVKRIGLQFIGNKAYAVPVRATLSMADIDPVLFELVKILE